MARILRGDIVWANLEPTIGTEQQGQRPVLVISDEVFNKNLGAVIAFALTSQEPATPYPLTYELDYADLPKRSWVKIGHIRTLSVLRLGAHITRAAAEDLEKIMFGFYRITSGI